MINGFKPGRPTNLPRSADTNSPKQMDAVEVIVLLCYQVK